MKNFYIVASLLVFMFSVSIARTGDTFIGSRAMGMGGANLANADDVSALYINPACLDLFQEHMQLTVNVGFFGNPELYDLVAFAINQGDKLSEITDIDRTFYKDLQPFDGKWLSAGVVPNVGFMARTFDLTWGATYYWNTPLRLMLDRGAVVPKFFIGAQMDQVLTASVAKRFGRRVSVGASLKLTDRYSIEDRSLKISETLVLLNEFSDEPMDALDPLLRHTTGPGLDVGALFYFGAFRLATSIQDFPAYMGGELLRPRFNIGTAYKLLALMETKLIDDATLTLDLTDLTKRGNIFTKLNMGAEARLNNLDIRAGIHQSYITAGATLHFFIFHLDYLHFTEELHRYAGANKSSIHFIQLGADIRF